MQEPPIPENEKAILPWARKLVEYLRENRPEAGPGMRLRRTRTGTILTPVPAPPSTPASPVPLHLLTRRPPYIPEPAAEPAGGQTRIFVEWGTLNDQLALNWDGHWDIAETTYFFAKATLRTADTLLIQSWEIVTGPAIDTHETEDWLVGEARPAFAVYLLGAVHFADGDFTAITNSGGGSLVLAEHLSQIQSGTSYGETLIGKQLTFVRNSY